MVLPDLQILETNDNKVLWEVLRIAGLGEDGTKRSIKICSKEHLHRLSESYTESCCYFGTISSRSVRSIRGFHPQDGHRIFVYQPLKLSRDLSVLFDADFLSYGSQNPAAVNPGVACDLLLTSRMLYESSPDSTDTLKAALLRKWCVVSNHASVQHIVSLLYKFSDFSPQYVRVLETEFSRLIEKAFAIAPNARVSPPSARLLSDASVFPCEATADKTSRDRLHDYSAIAFHPAMQRPCLPQYASNDIQIQFLKDNVPLPLRKTTAHQTQPSYSTHVRRFIAADRESSSTAFIHAFDGQTLNQTISDYYHGRSFLNGQSYRHAVDWFLDVELRRAEHVSDVYRATINMDPDPRDCAGQRIHCSYFKWLGSDARFYELYSESCLNVLGVPQPSGGGGLETSQFLNTIPIIINGTSYRPLRYYLDQAKNVLNPEESGTLSTLPTAFGLGDGHGGRLMVTQKSDNPPQMMYVDDEISGFHCPFLDMAKSIYNDAFFNVLYADLLCENTNQTELTATWDLRSEAIYINYNNISIDTITRVTALSKLEYILLPLYKSVTRLRPWQAGHIEKVLGSGLFCCALMSRKFAGRPDVFFLILLWV